MRKYFLLSAVALMAATTANATTDYAEVTARATIEVAGTLSCTNLDFGNIVVKQGNDEINMFYTADGGQSNSSDVLAIEGEASTIVCDGMNTNDMSYPSEILLEAPGKTKSLSVGLTPYGEGFDASLIIPANIEAGTYEKSITITHTY